MSSPAKALIDRQQLVALSMRETLSLLNSNLPLEDVLTHLVSEASRLLGSELSVIYIQSPDGHGLEMKAAAGELPNASTSPNLPAELVQELEAGSHVLVCDLEIAPARAEKTIRAGIAQLSDCCQALLVIPLRYSDQTRGALALYYSQPATISEEDVTLGWAFGHQAALAIQNAELQGRIAEIAAQSERERLARDLHDSVVQSLYSLGLLAAGWRRQARAGTLSDIDVILAEVGDLAQQALREMRVLVHALRPPDLANEGLLGALHRRLEAVEKRAGINVRLISESLDGLPPHLDEPLYHIAIEALNNATKHGNPKSVTIQLGVSEHVVEMRVKDDGYGFDPVANEAYNGYGLDNMRQRAAALGGTVEIFSDPAAGTMIRAIIPDSRHASPSTAPEDQVDE